MIATFPFNRLAYQDATVFLFRHMSPVDKIWDNQELSEELDMSTIIDREVGNPIDDT